jgi:AGZA family xanthine/uracil permease-like MFS transporter
LTSWVVAAGFLLALFLHPLILAVPAVATAPALVMVGVFMMQGVRRLDWEDLAKAVPAVLTMVLMPLTFSISEGIAVGFVAHVVMAAGVGRWREVSWVSWVLAGLFLAHFLSR